MKYSALSNFTKQLTTAGKKGGRRKGREKKGKDIRDKGEFIERDFGLRLV